MTEHMQITFDEKLYDVEAIQKAAYRSLNVFTVDITITDGKINCLLKPNISASEAGFAHGVEEFKKDVWPTTSDKTQSRNWAHKEPYTGYCIF